MIEKIIQMGRLKTVVIITLICIFASLSINCISLILFYKTIPFFSILISSITPALIAPTVSWYIVGLLIQVHQLEQEMRKHAMFDMLTEVMTRRAFLTECETLNQHSPIVLLYIDIDDFKAINDKHGHLAGDKVLASFGALLNQHKRPNDLAGRLGGEEFVLALNNADLKTALEFANHLCQLTEKVMINYEDKIIHYTISIGVSASNQHTLEQLLKQADHALYRAKKLGKNCVVHY